MTKNKKELTIEFMNELSECLVAFAKTKDEKVFDSLLKSTPSYTLAFVVGLHRGWLDGDYMAGTETVARLAIHFCNNELKRRGINFNIETELIMDGEKKETGSNKNDNPVVKSNKSGARKNDSNPINEIMVDLAKEIAADAKKKVRLDLEAARMSKRASVLSMVGMTLAITYFAFVIIGMFI